MGRFEREMQKETIRDNLDLVEVIGRAIPLKRSGSSYFGICPLHEEKTASFHVTPTRQTWHCFGCGQGGDVFSWYMDYHRVDFPEALRLAADEAGIVLEGYGDDKATLQIGKVIVNEAARYFSSRLRGAANYLDERGITSETAQSWQLGYAPNEWHGLKEHMLVQGFSLEELVNQSLVSKKQSAPESSTNPDDYYDYFRDRLMFPVCDVRGNIVGFAGRNIGSNKGDPDYRTPKYLNTKEGSLYHKSRLLFGLHRVSPEVRRESGPDLFVTEGYTDVISAHQAGITNVVGTMGTALTPEHALLLRRNMRDQRDKVVLVMDGDAAGINAGKNSAGVLFGAGISPRFGLLPQGSDLDELIRSSSDPFKVFEEIPKYDLLGFHLAAYEQANPGRPLNPDEKFDILTEVVDSLRVETDFSRKMIWISNAARRLEIPERAVEEKWYSKLDEMRHEGGGRGSLANVGTHFVAALLTHHNEWRVGYFDIPPDCSFFTPGVRRVYEVLRDQSSDLPASLRLGLSQVESRQRDFVLEQEKIEAISSLKDFFNEEGDQLPHELTTFLLKDQPLNLGASARILRREIAYDKRRALVDSLFSAEKEGNSEEVSRIERELNGALLNGS